MPNYCDNKVTIIGHKEDLDIMEDDKLTFSKFVPRPADQEENWYEWNNAHWGTKWEHAEYELLMREDNIYVAAFRTAWAPPLAFFESLLKLYPRSWIKCQFREEDCLAGVWVGYMKSGKVVEKGSTWLEPMPYLTTTGEIYIPEEAEAETETATKPDHDVEINLTQNSL